MELVQQLTEWSGTLAGLLWGNPLTLIILLGAGAAARFQSRLRPGVRQVQLQDGRR